MTTATTSTETHIGLGEVADVTARHSIQRVVRAHISGKTVTCECGEGFVSYSAHAFHLAVEAIAYARGRELDPLAEFDRKYGTDDA